MTCNSQITGGAFGWFSNNGNSCGGGATEPMGMWLSILVSPIQEVTVNLTCSEYGEPGLGVALYLPGPDCDSLTQVGCDGGDYLASATWTNPSGTTSQTILVNLAYDLDVLQPVASVTCEP